MAEVVRELMTAKNVTVTQLAKATGMAQPTLWRRVRGTTLFTVDEIALVAAELDVPVADLFARREKAAK